VGKKRFKNGEPLPPGASYKNAPKAPIFDDETKGAAKDVWFCPVVNGEVKGHGLVPRDYSIYPKEMFAPPSDIKIIPKAEWSDRIKAQLAAGTRVSDIRNTGNNGQQIPALDQNGQGFCWFYSNTGVVTLVRAINNQPYVRFSAHAGACKVKNFRDEGGWCGLSAKFWKEQGCPTVALWPEKSMSRSNDKPEVWANAALHKVTEDWIDLTADVYDQNLTFEQVVTLLLSGVPIATDYNDWSHSVCTMDVVEVEAGSFGTLLLNSWTDGWGDKGTGIRRGRQAIPDGAVALRVTGASAA
jgi:hypothetical protein